LRGVKKEGRRGRGLYRMGKKRIESGPTPRGPGRTERKGKFVLRKKRGKNTKFPLGGGEKKRKKSVFEGERACPFLDKKGGNRVPHRHLGGKKGGARNNLTEMWGKRRKEERFGRTADLDRKRGRRKSSLPRGREGEKGGGGSACQRGKGISHLQGGPLL